MALCIEELGKALAHTSQALMGLAASLQCKGSNVLYQSSESKERDRASIGGI